MTNVSGTTNTNPGNFANRPTEEVRAIASMGGKASHGSADDHEDKNDETSHPPGRNPDGTFTKGSEAAAEAGHKGGLTHAANVAAANKEEEAEPDHLPGRNPDGTFTKGSEAAAEAGRKAHH